MISEYQNIHFTHKCQVSVKLKREVKHIYSTSNYNHSFICVKLQPCTSVKHLSNFDPTYQISDKLQPHVSNYFQITTLLVKIMSNYNPTCQISVKLQPYVSNICQITTLLVKKMSNYNPTCQISDKLQPHVSNI